MSFTNNIKVKIWILGFTWVLYFCTLKHVLKHHVKVCIDEIFSHSSHKVTNVCFHLITFLKLGAYLWEFRCITQWFVHNFASSIVLIKKTSSMTGVNCLSTIGPQATTVVTPLSCACFTFVCLFKNEICIHHSHLSSQYGLKYPCHISIQHPRHPPKLDNWQWITPQLVAHELDEQHKIKHFHGQQPNNVKFIIDAGDLYNTSHERHTRSSINGAFWLMRKYETNLKSFKIVKHKE